MGIISGITVFLIIWWTVLFTVLPWKVNPPIQPEEGHAPSAPEKPMLGKKFLITTAISVVLWLCTHFVISSDLFSFRDLV